MSQVEDLVMCLEWRAGGIGVIYGELRDDVVALLGVWESWIGVFVAWLVWIVGFS